MKTRIPLLTTFIFLLFCSSGYSISNLANYISYKHVNGNAYQVSLHVYRDCRGIGYNDSLLMKVEGDNNCFNAINFYVTRDTIINGTFECSSGNSCNIQNGVGNIGVEEQIYSATIDFDSAPYKVVLDSNCCDIYFVYSDCCRSGAVTTGITGSATNYAYLNRCYGKSNISVNYNNKIALNAYCNTTFEYSPFAIDADGDSLVFSLDSPLGSSRTNSILFNTPLSPTIPITPVCADLSVACVPAFISGFYTGFDFDSITNTIRLTPKKCTEVSTFVNRTDEYRKDTGGIWRLIGTTRRDQLIFISQLNNNIIPSLETKEAYYGCVGDSVNILFESKDKAPIGGFSDSTYISWEHSVANASLFINDVNAKNQKATLIWTPAKSDILKNDEYVHLLVTESNCSSNTSTSKSIVLYAVDSLKSDYRIIDRKNGTLFLDASISGGSPRLANRITWSIDTLSNFTTPITRTKEVDSIIRLEPGKYYVRLLVENTTNCDINIIDSIVIDPYFRFNFDGVPTKVCKQNNLIIRPKLFTAKRPIIYQWYVSGSANQISSDSFLSVEINADIAYVLNAKDATNQTYYETISITAKELPNLNSIKNPEPRCFDEGRFDLYENYPTGIDLNQITKDSSAIWFNTVDKRRSVMVKQGLGAPYWYQTERFYNASLNNGYIPDPNVDTVRVYAQDLNNGCIDSAPFWVRIYANPVIDLNNLNLCQATGSFRPNELLITSPSNPEVGTHSWLIDSAPAGLNSFDLSQILVDEDPHPIKTDYHFYPFMKGSHPSNPTNQTRLGMYKLKFCYADSATHCQSCAYSYITISPTPNIEFTAFPKLCYNDPIVQLDSYVSLKKGRWELKYFNNDSTGLAFNAALSRMMDSTQIDINSPDRLGGIYFWRYVNESEKCPNRDSLEMIVNKRPGLQLNINKDSLYLGETILLEVSQGTGLNLKWENGNISPTRLIREFATPEGINNFIMTATNPATSCIAEDTAIITVIKTKRPTSVQKLSQMGLSVYPNPTNALLHIKSKYPIHSLNLMDPTGKQVNQKHPETGYNQTNKNDTVLDLTHLKPGVYFLHVSGLMGEAHLQILIRK